MAAGAAVSTVVVVAGVLLHLRTSEQQARPTTAAPAAAASPGPADAAEAAEALRALATDPASLVAPGAQEDVAGRAAQAVPEGTRVEPRPETWQSDGYGGGVLQVTLTPPGQPATSYLAVMVQEDGQWKVLATVPQEAAP